MFEEEAEEYAIVRFPDGYTKINHQKRIDFQKGAEFGYNKAKEDVKYDLMMKLKDEGIVKSLKDSILRNERLSSQEQQELCAWIGCAMDFGENLDDCAKELEEANKANEWHYVSKEGHPNKDDIYLTIRKDGLHLGDYWQGGDGDVIAWKEIVLPKEIE